MSPDHDMRLEQQPWWADLLAVKDTLSLRELAERFGTHPATIVKALRRKGIGRKAAPTGPRKHRKPSLTEDTPTELIAVREGTGGAPSRSRGRASPIESFATYVGTMPDAAVARMAGVTAPAVTQWRLRRGIRAFTDSGRGPSAPVRGRRKSGHLPAGHVERAPVKTALAKAPSARRSAWRITLDTGVVGYVVASTLGEAAVAALAAGTVTGIELAGSLLG